MNFLSIHKRLFGKSDWIENPELKKAIKSFKSNPTPVTRNYLHNVFSKSMLWMATKEQPEGVESSTSPTVLTRETYTEIRISTNASGEPMAVVFTDLKELQNRNKSDPKNVSAGGYVQSAEQIINFVLENEFAGIVINPAGNWVELSRAEIDEIFNLTA